LIKPIKMPFITKLDFSNNRQVKQYPETLTQLSGATSFGLPFGLLIKGPNLTTSAATQTLTNLVSTFSGNTGTTIFNWYDPNMALAYPELSAITPTNSATTQNTGQVYTGSSSTTIDGNLVNLTYSGVSFDLTPVSVVSLGGGAYSGTVHTNTLLYLSAGTLDFTGRTIWVDVSGITRTQDLIITDSPSVGYVWSCVSSEGLGAWQPISGVTASTAFWSASTGTHAIVMNNSNSLASNTNALAEGYNTTASGTYSHAEGYYTIASGQGSHAEGYGPEAKVTASGQGSHAEGYSTTASGQGSHSEGRLTKAIGLYSHAGGNVSIASGTTSFVHGSGSQANGTSTIVLGDNITGSQSHYTYVESLNISTVASSAFVNQIRIDGSGNLTTNTSDRRLKENISPLTDSLNKIKQLSGVTYQWIDRVAGGDDVRIGFIAQDVESVDPRLVFTNKVDGYMGIHSDSIIPMLVEAVKELSSGSSTNGSVYLETQTILAEDNDIQLNYSGTQETAIGGGIRVLHALGNGNEAEFITDSEGNWVTNNDLKPKSLSIPTYTPSSSEDTYGNEGNITRDDNYLYVKTSSGWKRSILEIF